jgi:hypothetical protein
VLLLCALGFLIYYLTKTKEPFANSVASASLPLKQVNDPSRNMIDSSRQVDPRVVQAMAEAEAAAEVRARSRSVSPARPEPRSRSVSPAPAPVKAERRDVAKEIEGPQLDVFHFEPNDVEESGASLDKAFERPIPLEARPDVVDVNKNNVKKYDAKDFLPKEINDQWFDTDFSQAKYNINDDKLINTERYVIGVNTVGQSLKNATYDIRGTIPNPKFTVSPWNNSTYEPDFNLKSLC